MRRLLSTLAIVSTLLATLPALTGCVQPNINVFGAPGAHYREQVLEGSGANKVLLLSVDGLISEYPREGLLSSRPSTLQEIAAQLKLARKDKSIKAVLLKVNSPGGTTTASDILYHELSAYKQETGVKLVTVMMGVAASGGYYVALPSDYITAHPTTITGSVGVIFVMPRLAGLMDKIGVGVDVSKSGSLKDMGSPFRPATDEEKRLTEAMTKAQAARFTELVMQSRKLTPEALRTVSTAQVFTAAQAKDLGLIDSIGYMDDALAKTRELAGLDKDAKLITYRHRSSADATYYQPAAEAMDGQRPTLLSVDLGGLLPPKAGLYYLWGPGYAE